MILVFLAIASPSQALCDRLPPLNDYANVLTTRTDGHKRVKRALPQIGAGFTGQEQVQITRGWKDACTLAVFALRAVGTLARQ